MEEERLFTLAEAHLYFAKTLNGQVWELLQKTQRTRQEDETMVHCAHASCYHWLQAGTGLHWQRAEWLIAHVYTALGLAEPALRHAARCLELTGEYAGLLKDFDIAYAYEGAARAYALSGRHAEAIQFLHQAQESGQAIQNKEDRELFLGDLNSGDWYGVK